jgi:hypothetical protein
MDEFNTVKTRVEIFHSMHDSIDCDKNDLANTKRILHDKFIRVEEVMAELEKHKFCSEYHKIQSKDNPEQFYKESCLFVIWKKLKDSLENKEVKADGTTDGIPSKTKVLGILPNEL